MPEAGPSSSHAGPSTASTHSSDGSYRPNPDFSFPPAYQPSIIRSFQKDSYYLSLLHTQLSDVIRTVFGSRFLQLNSEKITLLAGISYHVFTTWEGAQTLGEEYVGSRMVGRKGRYVSRTKRISFIFTQILAPFVLSRLYARIRRKVNTSNSLRQQMLQRAQMRWRAIHGSRFDDQSDKEPQPSRLDGFIASLSRWMPSLEDVTKADGWLSYAVAIHLMLFYLGGNYYKFGQRLVGVKYISIHPPTRPGQQPPSYEVLGVLLGVQLGVKMALSLNRHLHKRAVEKSAAKQGDASSQSSSKGSSVGPEATVDIDGRVWSHASASAKPLGVSRPDGQGHGDQDGEGEAQDFSDIAPPGPSIPLYYPSSTGTLLSTSLASASPSSRNQNRTPSNDEISAAQLRTAPIESISSSILKCTLCMDNRTPERGNSAITECGHLFDWGCIMNWLREKSECPLCRQDVNVNRVIPIYNI